MQLAKINFKAIGLGFLSGFTCMFSPGISWIYWRLEDAFHIPYFKPMHSIMEFIHAMIMLFVMAYMTASLAKNNLRAHALFICIPVIIVGVGLYGYDVTRIKGDISTIVMLFSIVIGLASSIFGAYIMQHKIKEGAYYYTPAQVSLATLIGGAIGGGWLMMRNYQLVDKEDKIHRTIIRQPALCALVVALFVLGASSSSSFRPTQEEIRIFAMTFHLLPLIIFYPLAKIIQQRGLKKEALAGAKRQTFWPVIVIGYISLGASFGLVQVFGDYLHISFLESWLDAFRAFPPAPSPYAGG